MPTTAFTADRLAARLARASRPQELDPIAFMLIHATDVSLSPEAAQHLWDCLHTLARMLPWTPNHNPAQLDPARLRHLAACELRAAARVLVHPDPLVVWSLDRDAFPLTSQPGAASTVLRFTGGACLTVPSRQPFPILE